MEKELKLLLVGFIAILIGVVLISEIADKVYENTQMPYDTITNETWTLNSTGQASTFWVTDANFTLARDEVESSSIVVKNSNDTALTLNTDYTVNSMDEDAVVISILDSAAVTAIGQEVNDYPYGNQTFIGYDRWQDNYIRGSSVARTLVGLVPLFFAIGILAVGIWIVYKGFKEIFA